MIVCHGTATPVPPPPSPPQHSPRAAAGRKPRSASPCSNHPGQAPAVPQQLPRPGGSRAPARAAAIRAGRQPSASPCKQPCSNHPGPAPVGQLQPSPVPRSTAALPRAARPAAAHHITAALLQQPVVAAATPQPCQSALVSLIRNHQLRQQP